MSEAAGPLNVAIEAVLLADPLLTAFLTGEYVYSVWRPTGTSPLDYIVLGSDDSGAFRRFQAKGETNGLALHAWSASVRNGQRISGKARVLTLAGHIGRILNDRVLTLDGYGLAVAGHVDLQATVEETDYAHAALRYSAISLGPRT